METSHTLYEWCLLNNIRPLDLELNSNSISDDTFMLEEISLEDFKDYMKNGHYKELSKPRKPDKFLELRMYGLVPYNISKIQQGIQFNHANDVYSRLYRNDDKYLIFRDEWLTNIILNGGTSNEGHMVRQGFKETMYRGTMQQHLDDLTYNEIKVATFYEPDLNSMLTAIIFLVDERVFNKELYPNFVEPPTKENPTMFEAQTWFKERETQYKNWVEKIGGPQNEFLREFLSDKRLA